MRIDKKKDWEEKNEKSVRGACRLDTLLRLCAVDREINWHITGT